MAGHFLKMEKLRGAGFAELTAVPEIGPEIAGALIRFFEAPQTSEMLERLSAAGVNFSEPAAKGTAGEERTLEGKSFVFSGTLERYTRNKAAELITRRGGRVLSSVSGKLDYLVVGDKPGGKLNRARELGVTVIDEATFIELLGESG